MDAKTKLSVLKIVIVVVTTIAKRFSTKLLA